MWYPLSWQDTLPTFLSNDWWPKSPEELPLHRISPYHFLSVQRYYVEILRYHNTQLDVLWTTSNWRFMIPLRQSCRTFDIESLCLCQRSCWYATKWAVKNKILGSDPNCNWQNNTEHLKWGYLVKTSCSYLFLTIFVA